MNKDLHFCRRRMKQIAEELGFSEEEKNKIDEMFIDEKKNTEHKI